uniref:Ig-like domain-containing protein n=1 Tax=Xenopus tropicalis TaxID=8364 RepID=A0A6I8RT83_XENTR
MLRSRRATDTWAHREFSWYPGGPLQHCDIVGQNGFPPHRAIKGSDSVIPCTSDVNGPPVQTIIWYFQHKEILRYDGEIRAVDPRYSLSTNRARDGTASLVISNITITDGGTYTCSLLYGQGKEDMEVTVDIQGKQTETTFISKASGVQDIFGENSTHFIFLSLIMPSAEFPGNNPLPSPPELCKCGQTEVLNTNF